jgi:hypothetical protein
VSGTGGTVMRRCLLGLFAGVVFSLTANQVASAADLARRVLPQAA